MARIMIVDDHPVVRMAVKLILEKAGHEIVAESDNGIHALDKIKNKDCDLLILDVDLPGLDGLQVAARLKGVRPDLPILFLTALDPDVYLSRCRHIELFGFIGKRKNLDELNDAVTAVLRGNFYYPLQYSRGGLSNQGELEKINALTDRELQVLRLLAKGVNNKGVAQQIVVSEKTISTYKARIFLKLNVSNVLELSELARRNNVVI